MSGSDSVGCFDEFVNPQAERAFDLEGKQLHGGGKGNDGGKRAILPLPSPS